MLQINFLISFPLIPFYSSDEYLRHITQAVLGLQGLHKGLLCTESLSISFYIFKLDGDFYFHQVVIPFTVLKMFLIHHEFDIETTSKKQIKNDMARPVPLSSPLFASSNSFLSSSSSVLSFRIFIFCLLSTTDFDKSSNTLFKWA